MRPCVVCYSICAPRAKKLFRGTKALKFSTQLVYFNLWYQNALEHQCRLSNLLYFQVDWRVLYETLCRMPFYLRAWAYFEQVNRFKLVGLSGYFLAKNEARIEKRNVYMLTSFIAAHELAQIPSVGIMSGIRWNASTSFSCLLLSSWLSSSWLEWLTAGTQNTVFEWTAI